MTTLSVSPTYRLRRACRIGPSQALHWLLLVLAVCMALQAFADTPGSASDAPPYPRDMPLLRLSDTDGKPLAELTLDDLEALPGRAVVGPIPDSGLGASHWYGVSLLTLLVSRRLRYRRVCTPTPSTTTMRSFPPATLPATIRSSPTGAMATTCRWTPTAR
ncbi:hypothetical protein [Salinicola tamaricis]|uniref:hypothetical protein n=1 Tax=Salinicola tamaricis TaxID=1771309 RepID=UPI000D0A8A97|nr:hypothetical protein [Salinicola tamaricis]